MVSARLDAPVAKKVHRRVQLRKLYNPLYTASNLVNEAVSLYMLITEPVERRLELLKADKTKLIADYTNKLDVLNELEVEAEHELQLLNRKKELKKINLEEEENEQICRNRSSHD